jgi:hypothetical protein
VGPQAHGGVEHLLQLQQMQMQMMQMMQMHQQQLGLPGSMAIGVPGYPGVSLGCPAGPQIWHAQGGATGGYSGRGSGTLLAATAAKSDRGLGPLGTKSGQYQSPASLFSVCCTPPLAGDTWSGGFPLFHPQRGPPGPLGLESLGPP